MEIIMDSKLLGLAAIATAYLLYRILTKKSKFVELKEEEGVSKGFKDITNEDVYKRAQERSSFTPKPPVDLEGIKETITSTLSYGEQRALFISLFPDAERFFNPDKYVNLLVEKDKEIETLKSRNLTLECMVSNDYSPFENLKGAYYNKSIEELINESCDYWGIIDEWFENLNKLTSEVLKKPIEKTVLDLNSKEDPLCVKALNTSTEQFIDVVMNLQKQVDRLTSENELAKKTMLANSSKYNQLLNTNRKNEEQIRSLSGFLKEARRERDLYEKEFTKASKRIQFKDKQIESLEKEVEHLKHPSID